MNFLLKKNRGPLFIHLSLLVAFLLSVFSASAAPVNTKSALLAPSVINGSFESDSLGTGKTSLSGWTVVTGAVDVLAGSSIPSGAADGSNFLDLANGTIEQSVSGFTANQPYVLRIDYRGNTADEAIKDAKVIIDGQERRQGLFGGDFPGIHSKENNDWVVCNGFEFTPSSSSVTIRIDSEESGSNGLLIDNIRIVSGGIQQPAEHNFNSLSVDPDGWRPLVNGSFEQTVAPLNDPENTGPPDANNPSNQNVPNPHLCGNAIPGWRVTRENTDLISGVNNGTVIKANEWNPPDGTKVMDVGGHGPGGIAQTITGLVPNSTYQLEFYAARHRFWETAPMTTELWSNGQKKLSFTRTISQSADQGYIREVVDLTSNSAGKITFEIFSKNIDKGGNNVMDAFRMIKVGGSATATFTPPPTFTATHTAVPTHTPTPTPTFTATHTAVPTHTPTATPTGTKTAAQTPTMSQTVTPTLTPSLTTTLLSTATATIPDGVGGLDHYIYLPSIINLARN